MLSSNDWQGQAVKRPAAPVVVGIGGWTFPPWRGTFYPRGLPHARELAYAGEHLTSLEINATFHGSQKPESFRRWRDAVPDSFIFSVKGPRAATWRHDLAAAEPAIARFLASGVTELGDKLGPTLWQFPPTRKFEATQVASFLSLLPRSYAGVALRHAMETPHPSFADPAYATLLERHGVAMAVVDADGYPQAETAAAPFVYARLKRNRGDTPGGYDSAALKGWLQRFQGLAAAGQPCFVYFIGGDKVCAPAAATAMLDGLATRSRFGRKHDEQGVPGHDQFPAAGAARKPDG